MREEDSPYPPKQYLLQFKDLDESFSDGGCDGKLSLLQGRATCHCVVADMWYTEELQRGNVPEGQQTAKRA